MEPGITAGGEIIERLRALEGRVAGAARGALRDSVTVAVADIASAEQAQDGRVIDVALSVCRKFYRHARSEEGLPLARSALDLAQRLGDPLVIRRAATACGNLAADTLDLVGAIEYHVVALRAGLQTGNPVEVARAWGNLGLAFGIGGNYELAANCHRRDLAALEGVEGPQQTRYVALMNLAMCLHRLGESREGLPFALEALREETEAIREEDLGGALNLRRNLVMILVACGQMAEAEPHVAECAALAARVDSPRARISYALTRATFELAMGQTDVALTRLEQTLGQSRGLPAALRDTLALSIRAEEAAGNVGRALIRLNELSEHIYRSAIERARLHIELAAVAQEEGTRREGDILRTRARLSGKVAPPKNPDAWPALDRLSVSALLPIDPTGWHGKRVGALVKSLALASGVDPLQALEMGLAAEVHDIGMMSVPDGVLRKREPYNDAERAVMLRHVEAGGEILRDDRHPRTLLAREIARYHHARWDGEGYPEAVAGRRIPFAARVCAVADAYDAMVCGLGTNKPKTMDEALVELRAQSGRQFDPELVDNFETMILTEAENMGVEVGSDSGMESFQMLVSALREDRGFV
jgi:putative two-component system response regulator